MKLSKSRPIVKCAVSFLRQHGCLKYGKRTFSDGRDPAMTAWQIKQYGDKLALNVEAKKPEITNPKDVLVKVEAVSVNPIDTLLQIGFGHTLLDEIRKFFGSNASLPLTLGRDFAGEVEAVGDEVKDFDKGDQVYGTVPLQSQGALADYVVTRSALVAKRPGQICIEEASGILYAGITAWSSLKIAGGLIWTGPQNIKALVIGGSGGVGQAAIQMLNHWGAVVITTCAPDAVDIVKCLDPKDVIVYSCPDALDSIKKAGKYDVILDASGVAPPATYGPFLSDGGTFIALRSPLMGNVDKLGLMGGLVQSGKDLFSVNASLGAPNGASVRWGYFLPMAQAVAEISELVALGQLKTRVHGVFPYTEAPEAYEQLKKGHLRGKIIISKKS